MVARRKTAKRGVVSCPKGKVRVCFCSKPGKKTTRRKTTARRTKRATRSTRRSVKRKATFKTGPETAIYDFY